MASHYTASPRLCLCIINREHPIDFTVGHLTPYMLFLVPRMYFMTCLAASTLFPVYVEEMEGQVPISKIGKGFTRLYIHLPQPVNVVPCPVKIAQIFHGRKNKEPPFLLKERSCFFGGRSFFPTT